MGWEIAFRYLKWKNFKCSPLLHLSILYAEYLWAFSEVGDSGWCASWTTRSETSKAWLVCLPVSAVCATHGKFPVWCHWTRGLAREARNQLWLQHPAGLRMPQCQSAKGPLYSLPLQFFMLLKLWQVLASTEEMACKGQNQSANDSRCHNMGDLSGILILRNLPSQ